MTGLVLDERVVNDCFRDFCEGIVSKVPVSGGERVVLSGGVYPSEGGSLISYTIRKGRIMPRLMGRLVLSVNYFEDSKDVEIGVYNPLTLEDVRRDIPRFSEDLRATSGREYRIEIQKK